MVLRSGGGLLLLAAQKQEIQQFSVLKLKKKNTKLNTWTQKRELTSDGDVKLFDVAAQAIGDVDQVLAWVSGRDVYQQERTIGGVQLCSIGEFLQAHRRPWEAGRIAVDSDVLSLIDHRRRLDDNCGVPGGNWEEQQDARPELHKHINTKNKNKNNNLNA